MLNKSKNKRLTEKEIFNQYPNQWVYIIEPEICQETQSLISGVVMVNSESREEMFRRAEYHNGDAAIRFTGENPNPESIQSFVSHSLRA